LGDAPKRHWLVVVSLDSRNLSDRASSVLIIPFGSVGAAGPATLKLLPGESGLPFPSYLKAHFIQVLEKKALIERHAPNAFSWTHKDGRRNDPTRRRSRCAVVGETLNGTLVICIILGDQPNPNGAPRDRSRKARHARDSSVFSAPSVVNGSPRANQSDRCFPRRLTVIPRFPQAFHSCPALLSSL
jgi:hypothetical protein